MDLCWSLFPLKFFLLALLWPGMASARSLTSMPQERGLLGKDLPSLPQSQVYHEALVQAQGEASYKTTALPAWSDHFSAPSPLTNITAPSSTVVPAKHLADVDMDSFDDSSDDEFSNREFATERPISAYRASWWAPSQIIHRIRRSITEHFASLQQNGIPYRRALSPSEVNAARQRRYNSSRRRSSSQASGSSRASSSSQDTNILYRGIPAAKYWAATTVIQTISDDPSKGLTGRIEFELDKYSLEGATGAELSIQFNRPTCHTILPFILFGDFQYWNDETSKYDLPSREISLYGFNIPGIKKSLRFNVTGLVRDIDQTTTTGKVLIRFHIRRELFPTSPDGKEVVNATQANLRKASRKLANTYHILSDPNPQHHYLRVDYIPMSPLPGQNQVHPILRKPEVHDENRGRFLKEHLARYYKSK